MHPMRRSLVSPVLVGRDAEPAILMALLDDAGEHRPPAKRPVKGA
jgi:hypothetical protein